MELILDPRFDEAMERLVCEDALPMKPSKVLRTAADLLERGWCQGSLGQQVCEIPGDGGYTTTPVGASAFTPGVDIGRLCLMGALLKAVVDLYGAAWPAWPTLGLTGLASTSLDCAMSASYLKTQKAVENEVHRLVGWPVSITTWNDALPRTQAEVVDVVWAAAAREEEAGR